MTTLALIGATGRTGRRVLDRALAAGYAVRAMVRDPAKVDREHANLTVVLSLFGQVKGSPRTLPTDGRNEGHRRGDAGSRRASVPKKASLRMYRR